MLATVRSLLMRVLRSLGLVVAGVYVGFAAAAKVMKSVLPSRGDAESDDVALVAIFDGVKLESRSQAFRGGSMLAWFGGVAVDLREAQLAPEGARLSLHSLFGGHRDPRAGGLARRVERTSTERRRLRGRARAGRARCSDAHH